MNSLRIILLFLYFLLPYQTLAKDNSSSVIKNSVSTVTQSTIDSIDFKKHKDFLKISRKITIIDKRIDDFNNSTSNYIATLGTFATWFTGAGTLIAFMTSILAIALPLCVYRQNKEDRERSEREHTNFTARAERILQNINSELSNIQNKASEVNGLISNLNKSISPPDMSRNSIKNKENLLEEGNKAHQMGKYLQALELYNKFLLSNPANSEVYNNIGLTYVKIGQFNDALKFYTEAIKKDPYNFLPLYNKGDLLLSLEQYNEAIECFDKILEVHQDPNIYNNKGIAYERMGDYKRALACFKKALEISPNILLFKQNMIASLLLNGEIEAAKQLITEQELIIPNPWTAKIYGHVMLLEGNYQEAENYYDLSFSRLKGNQEKIELLKEMEKIDIPIGKKAFPNKKESITFLESYIKKKFMQYQQESSQV